MLYNTRKHSNAFNVYIDLKINIKTNEFILNYSDDGIGFENLSKTNGLGVKNIYTRVAMINGDISIIGSNGFHVKITFKIK